MCGSAPSIELDELPLVETAANLFGASCYRYREELTAGILVAGWDRRKGGQVLQDTRTSTHTQYKYTHPVQVHTPSTRSTSIHTKDEDWKQRETVSNTCLPAYLSLCSPVSPVCLLTCLPARCTACP